MAYETKNFAEYDAACHHGIPGSPAASKAAVGVPEPDICITVNDIVI